MNTDVKFHFFDVGFDSESPLWEGCGPQNADTISHAYASSRMVPYPGVSLWWVGRFPVVGKMLVGWLSFAG